MQIYSIRQINYMNIVMNCLLLSENVAYKNLVCYGYGHHILNYPFPNIIHQIANSARNQHGNRSTTPRLRFHQ